MRKRIFSILLSLAVILSMIPAEAVSAADAITYVDENGNTQVCTVYSEVGGQTAFENAGDTWLVVTDEDAALGSITLGGIGRYHLIIKDGQHIEVRDGIRLGEDVSLSIYAQESGTGSLKVSDGRLEEAAIGGDNFESITINGGIIRADSFKGAAIGCDEGKDGGNITINGGNISCESYDAAAIGSSNDSSRCGAITINGGKVQCDSANGAGIGSGDYNCNRITINGGTVTSTSQEGAGIGSGSGGDCGDITINGGTVNASSDVGAGIGTGSSSNGRSYAGSIYINGGDVKASSRLGAGIGGGGIRGIVGRTLGPEFQSVIIKGGTIEAKSEDGAGIGMGRCVNGEPKMWDISIQGGTVDASSRNGAGIGLGDIGSGKVTMGAIEISDGAATASSTYGDAIGVGATTEGTISMGSLTAGEGCKVRTGKTKEEAVFVSELSQANSRYAEVWKLQHGEWSVRKTRSESIEIRCGRSDCETPPYSFEMNLCGEDREYTGQPSGLSFGEGETDTWIHAVGQDAPVITYYLEDGVTLTDPENSGACEEGAAPVKVGKYEGRAVLDFGGWDANVYKAFRILKAKPEITNIKTTEITYGQKLSESTLSADVDTEGTLLWTSPDTVPTVAESETKYFEAEFIPSDTENYDSCSIGAVVKVSPKEYPIELSEMTEPFRATRTQTLTYTYDGPFDVAMENSNPDAVEAVLDKEKKELKLTAKEEGDVKITVTTGADENHKAMSAVLEFTVWPEYTDIEVPEGATLTYDGTEQTGVEKGTGYMLTGCKGTDAGTYTATAELEDGYRWEDGSLEPKEISWEILKANPMVKGISAGSLTYGQSLADSEITWESEVEGTCEWKDGKLVPQAGTEEFEGVFIPSDTANYVQLPFKAEVTVEKAEPVLNSISASELTYGQMLSESSITYEGTEGSISWKDEAEAPSVRDSEYTEYDAVFTPEDTANYLAKDLKVKVKVNPAQSSLVLNSFMTSVRAEETAALTYTYDGSGTITANSLDPSVAAVSVDENNGITVTGVSEGITQIVVIAEGDINHKDSFATIVVTVQKAKKDLLSAEIPSAEKELTYTGKKQVGVDAAEGYVLKGNIGTDAGTYTATAILEDGYIWADGSLENKEITYTIAPAKLSKAKLGKTKYVYTGKLKAPAVTVKNAAGEKLVISRDYSLTNPKKKNVGKYTVTIKGTGNYTGTIKKIYRINPKGATILKPKAGKKSLTVKWKKQSLKMSTARITGYQIQIATDKKFTKGKKTVTVKGYSKTKKKISKLKAKKKYYVRVRTYKTVNKVKYYSGWSKVKVRRTK